MLFIVYVELDGTHTHFRSHLSDPAEPACGPKAPPGRPSRLLHKKKKRLHVEWFSMLSFEK